MTDRDRSWLDLALDKNRVGWHVRLLEDCCSLVRDRGRGARAWIFFLFLLILLFLIVRALARTGQHEVGKLNIRGKQNNW